MAVVTELDNLVQPGQILAGKYRIDRVLGKGGMGVVVAAHHIELDEKFAIKFLLPAAVGKPELMTRFQREARAAVKIRSEHIARVSDVGVLETGAPYMVMEFLQGQDLSERLATEGPIPYQQAADFVLQACEAIVEAHALGIVHRDLKPANLFVTRRADGRDWIKVLDFGISKSTAMTGSGDGGMTATQSMLGSPYYMSPEQMQSARTVDPRTDIWSLGCILSELVTGRVPFDAESLPELVLKIVGQPPSSIRATHPQVDSGFEQVVLRCLEKDRDRRFQHIGELAAALVRFGSDRARTSADRIFDIVQNSGLATNRAGGPPLPLPASSGPGPGTIPMKAVTLSPAQSGPMPAASSSSNGYTAQGLAPSPPPGTLPPKLGSTPVLGATTDASSWQTSPGIPKSSPLPIILAAFGALVVVVGAIGGFTFYRGHQTAAGGADASTSATPVTTTSEMVTPSSTPSAEPLVSATPPLKEPIRKLDDRKLPVDHVPDAGAKPIPPPPPPPPVPEPAPAAQPNVTGKPADCATRPKFIDSKGNSVFRKECF